MINFGAFEQARKKYKNEDFPFLSGQRITAQKNKPYQGLHILHNIPLTIEAVLKIEPLLLGGADLTMSCISILEPQKIALEILKDAHVKIQIEHHFTGQYDFCMDCCGELLDIVCPKIGASELTQTGSEKYKKALINYPMISIDDSELKWLETIFGTSEGFIQAVLKHISNGLWNKKVVVFGYGKVGTGLVSSLLKFTDNIVVIDIDDSKLLRAIKKGIKTIYGIDKQEVLANIINADLVVTATGVEKVLSNYYGLHKDNFKKAVLTNMGAEDEYGDNFPIESVLFNKKPLNFMLVEPTTIKYLDPILYAHNFALDLILSNDFKKGYNPLPSEVATFIFEKWCHFHNEEMPQIHSY